MFLLFTFTGFAQHGNAFYATMDAADAITFKTLYPDDIAILASTTMYVPTVLVIYSGLPKKKRFKP